MLPQQPRCHAHDAAKRGIVGPVPIPREVIGWEVHTLPLSSTTQGIMGCGGRSLKAECMEILRTFAVIPWLVGPQLGAEVAETGGPRQNDFLCPCPSAPGSSWRKVQQVTVRWKG